jgi:hypothetical protein
LFKNLAPSSWYFIPDENNLHKNGNMTLAEVKDIFSKNFIDCGINQGISDRTITDALSHMIGTYIVKSGSEYTLIHDFILCL